MSQLARFAPLALALMISSCSASEWAAVTSVLTTEFAPSPGSDAPVSASGDPPPSLAPLRPLPSATNLPELDVQFVVATAHEAALARATLDQLRREVDILNHYFVAEDGMPLIHFRFKGATTLAELRASPCGYDAVLDAEDTWQNPFWSAYKACADPRARLDPTAITFMVADNWSEDGAFRFDNSYGGSTAAGRFGRLPFVQLDWTRLDHRVQSPEEHEMGHAFGLSHVCEPGAKHDSDTNIMASHIDCEGSGGRRTRGFNADQVKTIRARAAEYRERFERNAGLLAQSPSPSPSL